MKENFNNDFGTKNQIPVINQNAFSFMEQPTNISVGKDFIHFYDYFFDKEINDLMKAISFLGNIEDRNPDDKILLYFESHGGSITCLNRLVDYIDTNPYNLEIVLIGDCASAGCYLPMTLAKLPKFLTGKSTIDVMSDTIFLLHLASCSEYDLRSNRDNRNNRKYNDLNKKVLKEIDDRMIELCKLGGLSEDDIKLLELGQDINFTSDEFRQILDNIMKKSNEAFVKDNAYEDLNNALQSGQITMEILESFISDAKKQSEGFTLDIDDLKKMIKNTKTNKVSEKKKKELKQKKSDKSSK